jgi:hypothetical protein
MFTPEVLLTIGGVVAVVVQGVKAAGWPRNHALWATGVASVLAVLFYTWSKGSFSREGSWDLLIAMAGVYTAAVAAYETVKTTATGVQRMGRDDVGMVFVALLLSGAMFSTGCALFRANATEPERPVAATGIAISDGLTKARIATTDLYNAKAFPFDNAAATERYQKVLGYFREAQVAGNQLADALAVYHAQPNEANAQKVAAVFATLNTKWPQITEELGGSSLPGRLVAIVAEVNKLMAAVRGTFAAPSALLQKEVLAWV